MLIFILLFCCSYAVINVKYLYKNGDTTESDYFTRFKELIGEWNVNLSEELKIKVEELTYNAENELKTILSNNQKIHIFSICSFFNKDTEEINLITENFSGLLWCINKELYSRCIKNVIWGESIKGQINNGKKFHKKLAMIYLTAANRHLGNFAFITSNDYPSVGVFYDQMKAYQDANILLSTNFTYFNSNFDLIFDTIFSTVDPVEYLTLSLYLIEDELDILLPRLRQKNNIIVILFDNLPTDAINNYITSFVDKIQFYHVCSIPPYEIEHRTNTDNLMNITIAAFVSFLGISNIADVNQIDYFIKYELTYFDSIIFLTPYFHLNTPLHIYECFIDKKDLIFNFAESMADPLSDYGRPQEYTCDGKRGKVKNNANIVMIVSNFDYMKTDENSNRWMMYTLNALFDQEIRTNGGIIGEAVELLILRPSDPEYKLMVGQYMVTDRVSAIFTYLDEEAFDQFTEIIAQFEKVKNIIFFNTNFYSGNKCFFNKIFGGGSCVILSRELLTIFLSENYRKVALISSSSITSTTCMTIIEELFTEYQISITSTVILIKPDLSETINALFTTVMSSTPDTIIISTCEEEYSFILYQAMYDPTFDDLQIEKYKMFHLNIETRTFNRELDLFKEDDFSKRNFYISHFYETEETEIIQSIKEMIRRRYGFSKYMSTVQIISYYMFLLWKNAVTVSNSFSPKEYRKSLYNIHISDVSGPYSLYESGYPNMGFNIYSINFTDDTNPRFHLDSKNKLVHPGIPYSNAITTCSWITTTNSDEAITTNEIIRIGLLYDTKDVIHREYLICTLTFIYELNQYKFNKKICKPVISAIFLRGDKTTYSDTIKYFSQQENMVVLLDSTFEDLNSYLVQYKLLLFSPIHSVADSCYSNVFYFGTIPNQRLLYSLFTFGKYSKNIVIVYDDEKEMSYKDKEYLLMYTEVFKQKTIEMIVNSIGDVVVLKNPAANYDVPSGAVFMVLLDANFEKFLRLAKTNFPTNYNSFVFVGIEVPYKISFLATDEGLWNNVYVSDFYFPFISLEKNLAVTTELDLFFGNSSLLLDTQTVPIYQTLLTLKIALESSTSNTLKEILYSLPFSLIEGNLRCSYNNHFSHELYIHKVTIKDGKSNYSPLFKTYHPIYPNEDKFYKCDFYRNNQAKMLQQTYSIAFYGDFENDYSSAFVQLTVIYTYVNFNNYIDGSVSHFFLNVIPYNCPSNKDEASYTYANFIFRSGALAIISCPAGIEQHFTTAFQIYDNPVYFIGIDQGDLCYENFISGVLSPYQRFVPAVLSLFESSLNKCFLVLPKIYEDGRNHRILVNLFRDIGVEIVNEVIVDSTPETYNYLENIVYPFYGQLPDGGFFISLLDLKYHNLLMESFSSYIDKLVEITVKDYTYIFFYVQVSDTVKFLDNSYSVAVYNPKDTSPANVEFTELFKTINMDRDSFETGPLMYGFLKFWYAAFSSSGKYDSKSIREYMNTYTIDSPCGRLQLRKDNYLTPSINLVHYIDNKITYRLLSQKTVANTFFDNFSSVRDLCEFSDIHSGRYTSEYIKIGLSFPKTSQYSLENLRILKGILAAIEYYNDKGGIFNKQLDIYMLPNELDYSSGDVYKAELNNFISEFGGNVIIGGMTLDFKTFFKDYPEKLIVYHPSINSGNKCFKNVFYVETPSTDMVGVPQSVYSVSMNLYVLYNPTDIDSISMIDTLEINAMKYGYVYEHIKIDIAATDLSLEVQSIRVKANDAVLVNFLPLSNTEALLIALSAAEMSPSSYTVININVAFSDFLGFGELSKGHQIWVLFENIDNEFSKQYKVMFSLMDNMSKNSANGYAAIQLYYNAMKIANTENINNIIGETENNKFDIIYGENLGLGGSHVLSKNPVLIRIEAEMKYSIIYQSQLVIQSSVYDQNGNYPICDFTDPDVGSSKDRRIFSIRIIIYIGGSYKATEMSALNGYFAAISYLNSQSKIYAVDPVVFICDTIEEVKAAGLEYATEMKEIMLFGGCTYESLNALSQIVENRVASFFATAIYHGQKCNKNIYNFGAVTNQFFAPFLITAITNKIGLTVQFLGMEDDVSRSYAETLSNGFSNITILLPSKFYPTTATTFETTQVVEIMKAITDTGNKGIILSSLTPRLLQSFLDNFYGLNYNTDNIKFNLIGMDEVELETIPADLRKEIRIIGNMFSTELNEEFKTIIFHYSAIEKPGQAVEAAYLSINTWFSTLLELIRKGDIGSDESALNNFRKEVTKVDILQFSNYKYKMTDSLHLSRPFIMVGYDITGEILSTMTSSFVSISPEVFNLYIPSTESNICDFRNDDAVKSILKMSFVMDFRENSMDLLKGVNNIIQYVFMFIDGPEIYGFSIDYSFYGIDDNEESCTYSLRESLKESDIVFTIGSYSCINKIYNQYEEKKVLLVNVGFELDLLCGDYYLAGHTSISQYRSSIIYYLSKEYRNYALIGTRRLLDYIKQILLDYKAEVSYEYMIDGYIYPTDKELTRNMLTELKEKMPRGIIFYFGSNEWHLIIDSLLTELNFSVEEYLFTSLSTSTNIANEANNIRYFESISNYFTAINTESSEETKKVLKRIITLGSAITGDVISFYEVMNMYFQSIQTYKTFDSAVISQHIREIYIDSGEGQITFSNNNYLSHFIYIAGYDSSNPDKFKIIHRIQETLALVYTIVYTTEYYMCDLSIVNSRKRVQQIRYIGIVFSFSGEWESEYDMLIACGVGIDTVNSDGGIMDYYIRPLLEDCHSDLNLCVDYIKKMDEDSNILMIIIGKNNDLIKRINNEFINAKTQIFSFGSFTMDRCSHTQINLVPTQMQIARAMFYMGISLGESFYIIYNEAISSDTASVLQAFLVEFRIELSGNIILKDVAETVKSISDTISTKTAIISLVDDNESKEFILEMCRLKLTHKIVLGYTIPSTVVDIPSECMKDVYLFTTFHESLSNPELNDMSVPVVSSKFILNYKDRFDMTIVKEVKPIHEAVFSSIYVFKEEMKTTYIDDPTQLRASMLNKEFNVPSGTIVITSTFFASRILYAVQYSNGVARITNSSIGEIQPELYNPFLDINQGRTCQITKNFTTEEVVLPVKRLHFYHEWDGVNIRTEILKGILEEQYVIDLNTKNPLPGIYLMASFTFRPLIRNELLIEAKQLSTDTNIIGSFGCLSTECRNAVSESYVNINRIVFITGTSEGELCNRYLFATGTNIDQRVNVLMDFVKDSGVEVFISIGTTGNSTEKMISRMEYEVQKKGFKNLPKCQSDLLVEEEFINCFNNNTLNSYRIIRIGLLIFYSNDLLTKIVRIISERYDMNYFQFVFFFYQKHLIPKEFNNYLLGTLIIASYDEVIDSELNKSFLNYVRQKLFRNIEVTEYMEAAYSSLELWKEAFYGSYELLGNSIPTDKYLRLALLNKIIDIPSGKLTVMDNNYVSRSMYLLQLDENGLLTQVYPIPGERLQIIPTVYLESNNECVFGKDREIYKTSSSINSITQIVFIILAVFLALNLVLFYVYSDFKLIKISSPIFIYISLVLLMILSGCGYIFTFSPYQTAAICFLRVWPLILVIDALFGIMVAKAWRIHKLFNNKELKKVKITNFELIRLVSILLIAKIIFLTIWWLVEPSVYIETFSYFYTDYYKDVYIPECTVSIGFILFEIIITVILFFTGIYLAWGVRKASSEFNDSFQLAISIGFVLLLCLLIIPSDFILVEQPNVLMVVRTIGIEMSVLVIYMVQFIPKVLSIYEDAQVSSFSNTSGSRRSSNQSNSNALFDQEAMKKRNQMKQNMKYPLNIQEELSPAILAEAFAIGNESNQKNKNRRQSFVLYQNSLMIKD